MEPEEVHGFLNPLEMSPEEMRKLGNAVIETIIEHFERLRYKSVTRVADRLQLEQRLHEPIPEKGTGVSKLLDQLHEDVFSNVMHLDHPRFGKLACIAQGPNERVRVKIKRCKRITDIGLKKTLSRSSTSASTSPAGTRVPFWACSRWQSQLSQRNFTAGA
jgi:hypothetical protein